jgi:starch phosphorylase
MIRVERPGSPGSTYAYTGRVTAARPATDYTPRVVAKVNGAAVPLETGRILWQR